MNVLPPSVKGSWDDMPGATQASLIAYEQLREVEEAELAQAMASIPKV